MTPNKKINFKSPKLHSVEEILFISKMSAFISILVDDQNVKITLIQILKDHLACCKKLT